MMKSFRSVLGCGIEYAKRQPACFSVSFMLNCLLPLSTSMVNLSTTNRQLNLTDDITSESNETIFENLLENSTIDITNTTESDTLFWTVPAANETTEETVVQMDDEIPAEQNEENGNILAAEKEEQQEEVKEQDSVPVEAEPTEVTDLNEKIVLPRMNCQLEMAVEDTENLKIRIKFGQLQNNTSGKCCITLNASESSLLAIFLSDIHLYQNGSDREVLQVVIANRGSAFILKEYNHWSTYQPLILTETHKVYLLLYYKVTTVFPRALESSFVLEVFTYQKLENHIQPKREYTSAFTPTKIHYAG